MRNINEVRETSRVDKEIYQMASDAKHSKKGNGHFLTRNFYSNDDAIFSVAVGAGDGAR